MNFEMPPYQRLLMKFITSVPEGYTCKIFNGPRGIMPIAIRPDKPPIYFRDGKWQELKPTNPQPEKLRGHEASGVIFDEADIVVGYFPGTQPKP